MSNIESMILVHSSDVVFVHEDDLAHYGVPGMKWGRAKRREAGNERMANANGSLKRANTKTIAKTVGKIVVAQVAAIAVGKITGSVSAGYGAAKVATMVSAGLTVQGASQVRNNVKSSKGQAIVQKQLGR